MCSMGELKHDGERTMRARCLSGVADMRARMAMRPENDAALLREWALSQLREGGRGESPYTLGQDGLDEVAARMRRLLGAHVDTLSAAAARGELVGDKEAWRCFERGRDLLGRRMPPADFVGDAIKCIYGHDTRVNATRRLSKWIVELYNARVAQMVEMYNKL